MDSTYAFESLKTRILLIEDNPADARLVELYLEESDLNMHKIVNRRTLAEGIEELKNDAYAAVLLDLTLPDSRGFPTLERLLQEAPDANVIVLTGYDSQELGINAVKAGAQDFLVKGAFEADMLARSLRFSMERRSFLNRMEEVQRIAHIGYWQWDKQDDSFTVSDEMLRMFDFMAQDTELDKSALGQYLDVQGNEKTLEMMISEAIAQGESEMDMKARRKNGERFYISHLCKAVKDDQGEVFRVRGIIQEITERKLAEQELLKSQERYQAIFTQSKDAIYISTESGRFLDFNQATVELFGYTREELISVDLNGLYKDPEKRKRFKLAVEDASFVRDMDIELIRKDGSIRYCQISASMIETDEFKGYHGIIRDVTERRKTDELIKAKEVAERTAMMKEQFLANVSHEMRTPMNGILGMSHLLLKTALDEEQFGYSKNIKMSSENLLGIINDILEISKIEFGKVVFEEKAFSLNDLLQNVMSTVKYKADEKGLQLGLEVEDDVPMHIIGDPLRLSQVLINLAGNASKFTEEGFVKIIVKNKEEKEGRVKLYFEIKDSGIGMAEDKLQIIFETFTQVSQDFKMRYGGTGLGLSITKKLVELQGGSIGVRSEENVGSEFFFELEYGIGKAEDLLVKEERIDLNFDKLNILLVEDHKMNQLVAQKTIEKEWPNASVTIADNGQIAIDIYSKNDFDIILMDIQMPVMDGPAATAYIRENFDELKSSIPILAMTAHAHISQDERYKDFGMDDFVLKPFEPNQLFNKIAHYANKRRAQISNESLNNTNMNKEEYQYVNLAYLELMADGDVEMKKVMLGMLLDEPVGEIQKMKRMYEAMNWTELRNVSHKMKSTLSFVGNKEIEDANKEIEHIALSREGMDKLPDLLNTVELVFDKALEELRKEYDIL